MTNPVSQEQSFEEFLEGIPLGHSPYSAALATWDNRTAHYQKELADLEKDFDEVQADKIEFAEHVVEQKIRIDELEAQLRAVREVFAWMEVFDTETAPEAYAMKIINDMYEASLPPPPTE